ncbi:MFS transporter [Janthinobacterium fluminis]|uniref:MFS transporter n=1 Tax=Janthinobacterium fluminis TaxID=2987524 RepID=A0ABT5K2N0_9BURK|nr:MFS transporter [Janthinobacterium fluminis]MDC8759230.1 MFS transporter [Janthinobacterium fluminis]
MHIKKPGKLIYFFVFFVIYELNIYLSNDMIMPAMLIVIKAYQAEPKYIPLSLSLYLLGGSALQIFLGPLADYIGKRKLMLIGNSLFLLATLMVPFSSTIEQFLATRFIQGMGCCFIFIGYAMIHELFDDMQAIKLISIVTSTSILAPLAGPIIGSAIISWLDWTFIFFISGFLGLVSLIGLSKYMPKNEIKAATLDLPSIRSSYVKIFTNRRFMFGIFVAGLATAPLTAWIGFSPIFIMQDLGASYRTYTILQCTILSGYVLSSIAIQKIDHAYPIVNLLRMGGLIAALGMLGAAASRGNIDIFSFCMFIYSVGFGLFNGALIRCSITATDASPTLASAALSLLYCIYLAIWLHIYNLLCGKFGYTLSTYALLNIPAILVIFSCLLIFSKGMPARGGKVAELSI